MIETIENITSMKTIGEKEREIDKTSERMCHLDLIWNSITRFENNNIMCKQTSKWTHGKFKLGRNFTGKH